VPVHSAEKPKKELGVKKVILKFSYS
jgi:hypothetical protein